MQIAPRGDGAYRLSELLAALSQELGPSNRIEPGQASGVAIRGATIELGVTWEQSSDGEVTFWAKKLGDGTSRLEMESLIVSLEPVGA